MLATAELPAPGMTSVPRPRWQSSPGLLATLLGAIATVTSLTLAWIPSFWGDEAASVMSAQRSLASLFPMLANIDAVHGAYYLFLHFWIQVFGTSEFAVRLPSAIAVGIATAGVVILVASMADRRAPLIAGVVCAVLPRFTAMGAEARSYAFSTAIGVWLTVLLVLLLRRSERRWMPWIGYSMLLAVGIYSFLYLGLVVLVHAAFVVIDQRARAVRLRWVFSASVGMLLAAPIVMMAISERGQIAFLSRRATASVERIVVTQWFGNVPLAIFGWALILLAVIFAVRHPRFKQSRLAVLAILWLALPTAVVVAFSAVVMPIYSVRYLSMSAPAAAILVALGVSALARGQLWVRLCVLGLIVVLAFPIWMSQRGEFAKDGGSDWRQVSSFIGAEAVPGDGVYFDPTTKPSRRPRLALHLYPGDYAGLVDVALRVPFYAHPGLWDLLLPLSSAAPVIAAVSRIWVVDLRGSVGDTSSAQQSALAAQGFALAETTRLHRTTVYEYTR
ncbi:glycosyltransferase family 39 protein [Salinibacterium sp.]|uniref:glycosyltransferase family 39 protein n=1 Tax=Salinibacterium sp. TaxID=1915057 RepID=UPI00286C2600|nr:glycosyltransferase family 39 protein [Salinibacterium sp.]